MKKVLSVFLAILIVFSNISTESFSEKSKQDSLESNIVSEQSIDLDNKDNLDDSESAQENSKPEELENIKNVENEKDEGKLKSDEEKEQILTEEPDESILNKVSEEIDKIIEPELEETVSESKETIIDKVSEKINKVINTEKSKRDAEVVDVLPKENCATVIIVNKGLKDGEFKELKNSEFKLNDSESFLNNNNGTYIYRNVNGGGWNTIKQSEVNKDYNLKNKTWNIKLNKSGELVSSNIGPGERVSIKEVHINKILGVSKKIDLDKFNDRIIIINVVNYLKNDSNDQYLPEDTSGDTDEAYKIVAEPYPFLYKRFKFKVTEKNGKDFIQSDGINYGKINPVYCYNSGNNFIWYYDKLYEDLYYKKFEQPENVYKYILGREGVKREGIQEENPNIPVNLDYKERNEFLKKRLANIMYCTTLNKYLEELMSLKLTNEEFKRCITIARQEAIWYYADGFTKKGISESIYKFTGLSNRARESVYNLFEKIIDADEILPKEQHFYFYIPYRYSNGKLVIDKDGQRVWQYMFDMEFGNDFSNSIEFKKVDISREYKTLSNVEFELEYNNKGTWEAVANAISNSEGIFRFENLDRIGEYRVMEKTSPEGYIKPSDPVAGFKVKKGENCNEVYDIEIAEKYATVNPNEIKNEKEGKFRIEKTDENRKILKDAEFDVEFPNGHKEHIVLTDGNYEIKGPEGIYKLVETKEPTGYEINREPIYYRLGAIDVSNKLEIEKFEIKNNEGKKELSPNKGEYIKADVEYRIPPKIIKSEDYFKVRFSENVSLDNFAYNLDLNIKKDGKIVAIGSLDKVKKEIVYTFTKEIENIESNIILENEYNLFSREKVTDNEITVDIEIEKQNKHSDNIAVKYEEDSPLVNMQVYHNPITKRYEAEVYINRDLKRLTGIYNFTPKNGWRFDKAYRLWGYDVKNVDNLLPLNFDYDIQQVLDKSSKVYYNKEYANGISLLAGQFRRACLLAKLSISEEDFKYQKDGAAILNICGDYYIIKLNKAMIDEHGEEENISSAISAENTLYIPNKELKIEFENNKNKLNINKVDTRGKWINGAEFRLKSENGLDETITVNGKFEKDELVNGIYTLIEEKAPPGYTIDKTPRRIVFTGKETKVEEIRKIKPSISTNIETPENLNPNQNQSALVNMKITLPEGAKYGDYFTVDINDKFTLDNLSEKQVINIYGKKGVVARGFVDEKAENGKRGIKFILTGYLDKLKEEKNPYTSFNVFVDKDKVKNSCTEKLKVSLEDDELASKDINIKYLKNFKTEEPYIQIPYQNVFELDIVNKKKLSLVIHKHGEEGELLAGAIFELTGPNGEKTEIETNSEEPVKIEGLKAGEYTLVEKTPPEGYQSYDKEIKINLEESTNIKDLNNEVQLEEKDFTPSEKGINPLMGQHIKANYKFNIPGKISPGSYFDLKLSDNINPVGMTNQKNFNIYDGEKCVAVGEYQKEDNMIRYIFTENVEDFNGEIDLNLYANRNEITWTNGKTKDIVIRTVLGEKESSQLFILRYPAVVGDIRDGWPLDLGSSLIEVDQANGRYKMAIYLNRKGRKNIVDRSFISIPNKNKDVKISAYRFDNNDNMPIDYAINFDNIKNYKCDISGLIDKTGEDFKVFTKRDPKLLENHSMILIVERDIPHFGEVVNDMEFCWNVNHPNGNEGRVIIGGNYNIPEFNYKDEQVDVVIEESSSSVYVGNKKIKIEVPIAGIYKKIPFIGLGFFVIILSLFLYRKKR